MNVCIKRARDGDPTARQNLIDALRPRVTKMAFHYARRTGEDADDLLQEAWVGLLEALPAVDMRIGSPEQYLVQHARWRLLDAIKRARVRKCLSLDEITNPDSTCETSYEAVESAATASEFTRNLKPVQREVLACLLAGLTWRETGAILGCSSANIAYHVRQIRKHYEQFSSDETMVMTG